VSVSPSLRGLPEGSRQGRTQYRLLTHSGGRQGSNGEKAERVMGKESRERSGVKFDESEGHGGIIG